MTILSDRQITEKCTRPFEVTVYPENPNKVENGTTTLLHYDPRPYKRPTTPEEDATWESMISPFSAEQVRQVPMSADLLPLAHSVDDALALENQPMRRIISRGLTSYGYDVSLSGEFKLFTNINSTIIDPKRFDESCLVDAELKTDEDGAKYIILPPNSYALGRTVEYFCMPRNTMAECLGKSTYARAGVMVNVTPIEPGFKGHVVIEISNSTNLPTKIYAFEGISQFVFHEGEDCLVSYADRGGKYQGQTGITLPKA